MLMLILDIRQIIFHKEEFKQDFLKLWSIIKPYCDIKLLLCYLPYWFIATGWAWLFSIIGKGTLRVIAISWLAFMWMPFCPEKLITIPLAIWTYKKLFKKENATLNQMLEKEKKARV